LFVDLQRAWSVTNTAESPALFTFTRPVSFHRAAVTFVAVYALCLVPLLMTQNPPLHDYPFHIARIDILSRWHDSSVLRSYYDLESFLIPNVGMDVIAVLLAKLMPIETAGMAFIGFTLALQLSGCMALYRSVHGYYGLWPLVAGLFLFNWIFLFGFLNYLFGVGLLLWATAIWISLSRSAVWPRIFWGSVFSVALFFSHIVAVGLFAVIVAGYELQRAVAAFREAPALATRDVLVGGLIFILPICLFFASATAAEGGGNTSHSIVNLLRTPAIFVRVLLSGHWTLDIVTAAVTTACLAMLILRGRLSVARPMYLAIALLMITFVVMPHELFGGWGADTRIPVVIVFVLIASTRPILRNLAFERAILAILVGGLIYQSAMLSYDWHSYDRVYRDFRTAFTHLPANSVLFAVSETPLPSLQDIDLRLWHPPLPHVAELAVLDSHAFVPQLFAQPGQQPIKVTERYAALYAYQHRVIVVTTAEELSTVVEQIRGLLDDVQFAGPAYLLLTYPQRWNLPLPQHAPVIASGPYFVMMELERDPLASDHGAP
jgi:hypothetical protein